MAESILQNKRVRVWGTLGILLAASVVLLILAIQSKGDDGEQPAAATVLVVDEAGVPLTSAVMFVRRKEGSDPTGGTRWNPETAELSIAAADVGSTVLFGAPGFRVRRVVDVQKDETVILRRGYTVRIKMGSDAPPLDPPLVGVFRIRPTDETASLGEGESTRPLDLSGLMQEIFKNREKAPEMPYEKFGFAISEADAASGLRVPAPGTYEVVWGMLDERPMTWFTHGDCPTLTIEVKDIDEPQIFEFEIDRPLWNRTREGLKERIEAGG